MGRSTRREIEIKLAFDSPRAAPERLEQSGAKLLQPRQFEDNKIFDRDTDPLASRGMLLRVRRFGDRGWLTVKAPVEGKFRHKVRKEYESEISDVDGVVHALEALGFSSRYRYQKYRTHYGIDDVEICLDETPIGCYVELEGPPDRIDRVAAALGFGPESYVLASYRELHEKVAREAGDALGDMVFAGRIESDDT